MSQFSRETARQVALATTNNHDDEAGLVEAFTEVCHFLHDHPESLSWRSKKNRPDVYSTVGLERLADKYFKGYRRSDFPKEPTTISDEAVSIVMQIAYGYSQEQSEKIKIEHKHSMSAENCVGALLERYLDSILRAEDWHWCCGDFVKAVDFVKRDSSGQWLALQIKNRDNSENSSSSAVRSGTTIQKWFRSFSKKRGTNWGNLPPLMQGYGLSEQGFLAFIRVYLTDEKS